MSSGIPLSFFGGAVLAGLGLLPGRLEVGPPTQGMRAEVLVGRVVGLREGRARLGARLIVRGNNYLNDVRTEVERLDGSRFRLHIRPTPPDEELAYELILWTQESGADRSFGRLAWRGRPSAEARDIGDLQLAPPPLLVAGVVQAPGGGPLAGASIEVQTLAAPHPPDGGLNPANEGREHWNPRTELSVQTGADGAFAVHGLLAEGERKLRIRASHPDIARMKIVVVDVGARGIQLVGQEPAALEGRVLLDEAVPRRRVVAELRGPAPDASESQLSLMAEPLRFTRLVPGRYVLVLRSRDEAIPVFSRELSLRGEVDLGTIDLRGRLRASSLRVEDVDGAPVHVRTVAFGPAGAAELEDLHASGNEPGITHIVTQHEAIDLRIDQRDHRRAELRGARGPELHIVLRPALEVHVLVRGRLTWLPPDAKVRVTLSSRDFTLPISSSGGMVDERDLAIVRTSAPGRYTPCLAIEAPNGSGARAFGCAHTDWLLLDADGPQPFTLEITPELSARLRRYWEER